MAERLGEILLRDRVVSQEQLLVALGSQRDRGGSLGENLVLVGAIPSVDTIVLQLAEQLNTQVVNLQELDIPPSIVSLIPEEMALKYGVLPIQREEKLIHVVIADPRNIFVTDAIKFLTGCHVHVWMAPESQLKKAIEKYYVNKVDNGELRNILQDVEESAVEVVMENHGDEDSGPDYMAQIMDAPIVRLVNKLISDAVRIRASDIHVEVYEKSIRVRYRLDGTLIEQSPLPFKLKGAIVSRLKIMANLDISERRLPQDGRIKITVGKKTVDLRVNTLPCIHGEKVVLRILDQSNLQLDLSKTGLKAKALNDFKESLLSPYGMILVTGPTGSGKTTTLYSAISTINQPDTNIMTAEDPVEYNLSGVNQVLVNPDVGLTFASALRAFLRQDPDVIMVGEIRDLETAQIAVKAALTGHLVLSTLHTNDAPSTISRLCDMGIEPYLIASSVRLVTAQRLVRKLCEQCKKPIHLDQAMQRMLEMLPEEVGTFQAFESVGCAECSNTGFRGRIAVHQVMPITDMVKGMIVDRATPEELEKAILAEGVLNLRLAAIEYFKIGLTSAAEVIRTTKG